MCIYVEICTLCVHLSWNLHTCVYLRQHYRSNACRGPHLHQRWYLCFFLLKASELEILFWWSAEQRAWVERKSVDCSVWRTGDYVYCGRGGGGTIIKQTAFHDERLWVYLYNSLEVSCDLASSYTHWLWQPRLHPHPSPPLHKFTYGAVSTTIKAGGRRKFVYQIQPPSHHIRYSNIIS